MAYTLIIGNKNYSSWSMRAWLLMEFLGLAYDEVSVALYAPGSRSIVESHGGQTGLVPVLKDGDTAIWDTMAIVEHLFESHPELWPETKAHRARARSICGEVHSGMNALRNAMPVNTRGRNRQTNMTEDVRRDIARVEQIWAECLTLSGGPWLFGPFCAADILFAPIATRFQTYAVELGAPAAAYRDRILAHPLVSRWLALGEMEPGMIALFEDPHPPL
jgi:glutathione S-transferase